MRQSTRGHDIRKLEDMTKSTRAYMQIVLDELNKGSEISIHDAETLLPMLEKSTSIRRMCAQLELVRGIPIDMTIQKEGRYRVSYYKLGLEVDA